ncbi:MAG: bifunctional diguanylate cyclase/phosphodiesterase [Gammaproteobacteria bacterium]|nr:bifunctional diguanylate cyclase/phosphodiesterase [Gammaproteobacteria bacterium]
MKTKPIFNPEQEHRTLQAGISRPWLSAILIVCCLLFFGFYTIYGDYQKQLLNDKQRLSKSLKNIQNQVALIVHANMIPLEALRTAIKDNPQLSHEQFVNIGKSFLNHPVHIKHLIMAPDFVVKDVYPPFSDTPLTGLELVSDPGLWEGAIEAVKRQQMLVSGPFQIRGHGNCLLIWAPVHVQASQPRLWGVAGVLIDHQKIMQDTGVTSLLSRYQVRLMGDNEQQQLELGQNSLQPEDNEFNNVTTIQLPFGNWKLKVASIQQPWYLMPRYQRYALLVIGLAVFAGLAIWSYIKSYKQRKKDFKSLEFHRRYDLVTKLPNRSLLLSQLSSKITRASKSEIQPFALFYIDLDYFKQVNDMLGYRGGDQFLRKLSTRLKNSLQPGDLLARSGSDEFVMTVQNIHRQDQAETVAKNLLRELSEPMRLGGHSIASSCSIGVALYPRDGDDGLTLLRYADRAMYQAKKIGRGTYSLVDKALRSLTSQELKKRMSLQQALHSDQFRVCYQPIIDLRTGKISKCEALITWRDKSRMSVLGNDYIAVAEQGGLIRHLGLWVLERVCQDIRQMHRENVSLQVAVNRSSQEFLMPDASLRWLEILDKHNIAHKDIVFEITESLLMDEKEKILQQIRLLKDSGIEFSVDDFGTGYSAINYLRRFPVNFLKIDQSFVHQLQNSKQDKVLVDIMIKLGSALNINVIAEGVETENQYISLKNMGCHFIQGYYVSKPLHLEELIAFKKDEANKRKWQTLVSQR